MSLRSFNGNRLAIARKRRRLTAKALAELAGVSPVTLNRIEKCSQEPEPETVEKFVSALGYPQSFFVGDDIDDLTKEAASFRSLTKMTAREREAAIAAGSLAYLFCDWVTERFDLPKTDLLDLSFERNPEAAARALREQWGLGEKPVANMIKLLEAKGVRVFSLSENTTAVDAFSCWRGETPYVFLNTFKSAEHSRYDAAHELAHLVLHKHGGPQQGRAAELEANAFASAFLMPAPDVRACVRSFVSLNKIIQWKARWRVSAAALAYRIHKLRIVSDWQYRSLCIEINRRGYRTREPNEIERERSIVWKKVLSALWGERVTRQHIASDLHLPPEEIEGMIFGLVADAQAIQDRPTKPELSVISNDK